MNGNHLVRAVQYLLEKEQAVLLSALRKSNIGVNREGELGDEIREIEDMLERAREGWTEI